MEVGVVCCQYMLNSNCTRLVFVFSAPIPIKEHHLALRSEGVKMVVDSEQPHFVGVDPDFLSTGLVFYYLKVPYAHMHVQSSHM